MPRWSKNYLYLGGRLLATEAPNGTSEVVQYHHPDRLGTKLVTNNLDTTFFSQANLPFGTALDAESTGTTNRRFTSYDRSATTGLDYAINRHYDPRQGRFTQPDPLGMAAASLADPQTLNMYSYVGNDPVNRVDPDGQFWGALVKFIAGLFTNLRPNVINGSFAYKNQPTIAVSFTTNFQNIGVGYGPIGFNVRTGGQWIPELLDPFVDRFQEAVNAARGILSEDNSCSEFFGGVGVTALDAIAAMVKSSGDKAYQFFPNDSLTGIRMQIPTMIRPEELPVSATSGGYIAVSPLSVAINSNGAFVKAASTGTALASFGHYSPGSLQSRVLQLLHEVGHLVIVRSQMSFKFIQLSKSKRQRYEMRKLVPLLPLDSDNLELSSKNTERVLSACRNQINNL
jgi:RHS repeat-associated protein